MLNEKFGFRNIKTDEVMQAVSIEQICFPPNEACSEKSMKERVEMFQSYSWLQQIGKQEKYYVTWA